jgi:hypothetical protein
MRGDVVVQVVLDGAVQTSCALTAVTNLRVWFKGRFQARFATDGAPYNEPRGRGGWTFALEEEPDFVPADSLVDRIDKPVGREIRFNNPVALRPLVPPIGVAVVSITGKLANGKDEEFTSGDPVLGQPVDLGPHSYFAGNSPPPAGTTPAEGPYGAGVEPIALFEFHIGNQFSGKSLKPEDRPITDPDRALEILTPDQIARFGIPALLKFPPDPSGPSPGQPTRCRSRTAPARSKGETCKPGSTGWATLRAGWLGREWFMGLINDAIQIDARLCRVGVPARL